MDKLARKNKALREANELLRKDAARLKARIRAMDRRFQGLADAGETKMFISTVLSYVDNLIGESDGDES